MNEQLSEENVNCVIEAMKISPIKEIGILLQEQLPSESEFHNEDLLILIDKINNNGSPADTQWVITKEKYNWK